MLSGECLGSVCLRVSVRHCLGSLLGVVWRVSVGWLVDVLGVWGVPGCVWGIFGGVYRHLQIYIDVLLGTLRYF